jgi:hypothetical protein
MNSSIKKKHTDLFAKKQILDRLENGESIIKNGDSIWKRNKIRLEAKIDNFAKDINLNKRKILRKSTNEKLDAAVIYNYKWITEL